MTAIPLIFSSLFNRELAINDYGTPVIKTKSLDICTGYLKH
jgi:hypothetical protein